ncbi:MAG: ATP-binding protein, partial [Sedimenticolaceae bacterium]
MLSHPYPGLRPFGREEDAIFFGRENQVDDLLDRLQETHFLAVIGTSGSGKSSLVRAGLLPALDSGFMAGAGPVWSIA